MDLRTTNALKEIALISFEYYSKAVKQFFYVVLCQWHYYIPNWKNLASPTNYYYPPTN